MTLARPGRAITPGDIKPPVHIDVFGTTPSYVCCGGAENCVLRNDGEMPMRPASEVRGQHTQGVRDAAFGAGESRDDDEMPAPPA